LPTTSTISLAPDGDGNAAVMIDGDQQFTIRLTHEGWQFVMPRAARSDVAFVREPLDSSVTSGDSGVSIDDASKEVVFALPGRPDIRIPIEDGQPDSPSPGAFPLVGQDVYMRDVGYALLGRHNTIVFGPTGCGKTASIEYITKALNWNLVIVSITPGSNEDTMVGTQMPAAHETSGAPTVEWVDRMIAQAVRLSHDRPTVLLIDEINRIRDVNEYACMMSLLDSTQRLTLPTGETIDKGDLVVIGTANPPEEYIGTNELDPAFENRLPWTPRIDYPAIEDEAEALVSRVPTLSNGAATTMATIARKIRDASEIMHPIGFRSLLMWAEAVTSGFFTWHEAVDRSLVAKFPRDEQQAVLNVVSLFAVDDDGNPLVEDTSITSGTDPYDMWFPVPVVEWDTNDSVKGYGRDANGQWATYVYNGTSYFIAKHGSKAADQPNAIVFDLDGSVASVAGIAA
jgi:MoxR-like ATPase